MSAVKNAVAAMVSATQEITIKHEEDAQHCRANSIGCLYCSARRAHTPRLGSNEEYKKILKDVEHTTPIINALNELPVYYHYHFKKD